MESMAKINAKILCFHYHSDAVEAIISSYEHTYYKGKNCFSLDIVEKNKEQEEVSICFLHYIE